MATPLLCPHLPPLAFKYKMSSLAGVSLTLSQSNPK